MRYKEAALAAAMAGGMLVGTAAPAFAWDNEPPAKCNSGRGNGSETTPANDCDPRELRRSQQRRRLNRPSSRVIGNPRVFCRARRGEIDVGPARAEAGRTNLAP